MTLDNKEDFKENSKIASRSPFIGLQPVIEETIKKPTIPYGLRNERVYVNNKPTDTVKGVYYTVFVSSDDLYMDGKEIRIHIPKEVVNLDMKQRAADGKKYPLVTVKDFKDAKVGQYDVLNVTVTDIKVEDR